VRLAELVRRAKPKLVVECGTAIGYSGLWIARELKQAGQGHLITIELVPANAREAEENFRSAGLEKWVTVKVGDARKVVPEVQGPIDFLFLDCGYSNYHPCFVAAEKKLSPGATVVADNAGIGSGSMDDYLKLVRAKYQSRTEWFDVKLPWGERDAMEVTVIAKPK
jgi:predicted O-methyltransferase YrrM